jgi:hypothetical protein
MEKFLSFLYEREGEKEKGETPSASAILITGVGGEFLLLFFTPDQKLRKQKKLCLCFLINLFE